MECDVFGTLGNLGALFKQAKQLEGKLAGMTDDLRSRRVTGAL